MTRRLYLLAGLFVANLLTVPDSRRSIPDEIVRAARNQIGTQYEPGYVRIAYPNGDLPSNRGVCTDVVIRSLRAVGYDLQELIHKDMSKNFDNYPQRWGLKMPDTNIDHRRVPNQMKFFERRGRTLTLQTDASHIKQWEAGDFVYWQLSNRVLHCGVVSDKKNSKGLALVIHNLSGCVEEDCLTRWKIIGHFRYP